MRHSSSGIAIDQLALAILRDRDQIVLVQQQHPDAGAPYWVLPGGLVEAGELINDALIREVREEAGVQVTGIALLVCVSQIDRPEVRAQTVTFIFEVETWRGSLVSADPDGEVLRAELVPLAEAISRLQDNGGWRGIQEPLLAYVRGEIQVGAIWFYREEAAGQHLLARVPQR